MNNTVAKAFNDKYIKSIQEYYYAYGKKNLKGIILYNDWISQTGIEPPNSIECCELCYKYLENLSSKEFETFKFIHELFLRRTKL